MPLDDLVGVIGTLQRRSDFATPFPGRTCRTLISSPTNYVIVRPSVVGSI